MTNVGMLSHQVKVSYLWRQSLSACALNSLEQSLNHDGQDAIGD